MKDDIGSHPFTLLAVVSACWAFEGGIEKVQQSLLRFWQKDDRISEVTLLVLHDRQEMVGTRIKEYGLGKINAYGFCGEKGRFALAFLKIFSQKRPNLVFFGHIHLIPLGILASLWNIPILVMIYGVEVWRKPSWLQRIVLNRISAIISISNLTKEKASIYCNTYLKSTVCHLGIPRRIVADDTAHTSEISWAERRGKILCVGRMNAHESYKGQDTLIRSMVLIRERFPDSILILVGRGSGVDALKKLAKDLGVEKHVYFAGFVSDRELSFYYQLCDVFAMPSRGEGFGLVYLEAMAHGKPCVGGTVDAAGEIIVDGKTGFLVDPDNIQKIANRISRLLGDPILRQQMGEEGRKRFERVFTEDKFHERLAPFFDIA